MTDTNLTPSIDSLTARAAVVSTGANAKELAEISRVGPSLERTDSSQLETAIDSRAQAIAPEAVAAELKNIGKAISNVLEPSSTFVGEFVPPQVQNSNKFLGTDGISKGWSEVSLSEIEEAHITNVSSEETLVYNIAQGYFENSSQIFRIAEVALTASIPESGAFVGETIFDQETSKLKYWDGSAWEVAAVVAAAAGGPVASFSGPVTVSSTIKFGAAESSAITSTHQGGGYPGFHSRIAYSEDGNFIGITAVVWTHNNKVNQQERGRSFIFNISDLDNITHITIDTAYTNANYISYNATYGWSKWFDLGRHREVISSGSKMIVNSSVNGSNSYNATAMSQDRSGWPMGYALAQKSTLTPKALVYDLSDTSTIHSYLCGVGNFRDGMAIDGEFVAGQDIAGNATAPWGRGMHIWDMSDADMVAPEGSLTGTGDWILDNGNNPVPHIFPKYYIPKYGPEGSGHGWGYHGKPKISGDYVIRALAGAADNRGLIQVYKISELVTIKSGLEQVAPFAQVEGSSSSQMLGYEICTDGTNIYAMERGFTASSIRVYDMSLNLIQNIDMTAFPHYSANLFQGGIAVSTNFLLIGFSTIDGIGGSNTGAYYLLNKSDNYSLVDSGVGGSANFRMGFSVAIDPFENSIAITSQLTNEYGQLDIKALSIT